MRLFLATILMAFMASNVANASSFVTPDEITAPTSASMITLGGSSPSIVAAGEPSFKRFGVETGDERKFVTVSPSVVAMVDAPQPVAFENVASIGDAARKKRLRDTMPMVIRGGIMGSAFTSRSAPVSGGAPSQPQQQVSAPGAGAGKSAPSGNAPGEPEDKRMPKSALPPSGRME